MRFFLALFILLHFGLARAEEVIRVDPAQEFKETSLAELQQKVWQLEKAVAQLQQKIFDLKVGAAAPKKEDKWFCKIRIVGDTYTGIGMTKDSALAKVIQTCKESRIGNSGKCINPDCNQ